MAVKTTSTAEIPEEGTIGFTVAFVDEEGTAMVPDSITWTLTDTSGNVINSRSAVSIGSPAASVTIVLSGDDLAIGTNGTNRILLVEFEYSSTLGNNLPDKHEIHFKISNLTAVT